MPDADADLLAALAEGLPEPANVPGQLGLDGSMLIAEMEFTDLDPDLVAVLLGEPLTAKETT